MKVYLLFEWTEERESKIHYGVFSTAEFAKARADLEALDCEEGPLDWDEWEGCWTGEKFDGLTQDYPYEIIEFELDSSVL